MDRAEKPRRKSEFANQGLDPNDTRALGSLAGRAPNKGADPGSLAEQEVRRPVGAPRRSDITDHTDDGSDETPDGLNPTEEAMRRAAEELPIAPDEPADDDEAAELAQEGGEDTPVFDSGDKPPRV